MHYRLLLCLAVLLADAALARPHFNLTVGDRDETDRDDRLPAIGMSADFGPDGRLIRPEFGVALGFDPIYGGNESEVSAGAIAYWEGGASRIHFAAGLSSVSSDFGANSGSSTGIHVHGGVSWQKRSRWMGVDVRYLEGRDLHVYGTSFPIGYLQFAFLLGW
jgi:hypothetical protein